MSLKILHIADVHLDRPFVGLSTDTARERRRDLRGAFDRCLSLAQSHSVDAVTIGGDLWEDEHVTPDTCRWVADRLGRLCLPVIMVAGNHDPLRRGGPYQRVQWPENVHLLSAELIDINQRRYAEIPVDCAGATSSADVEQALAQTSTTASRPAS